MTVSRHRLHTVPSIPRRVGTLDGYWDLPRPFTSHRADPPADFFSWPPTTNTLGPEWSAFYGVAGLLPRGAGTWVRWRQS